MELTVKEVAELRGCSERYVKNLIAQGKLRGSPTLNAKNRKKYLVPLEALDPLEQVKYYRSKGLELPMDLVPDKKPLTPARVKPLEEFTIQQREEISAWVKVLEDWQSSPIGAHCMMRMVMLAKRKQGTLDSPDRRATLIRSERTVQR